MDASTLLVPGTTWWTGAAITGVALALALYGELRDRLPLLYAFKPTASAGFLLAAVGSGALDHSWGVTVFVGLLLSTVGDVALMGRSRAAFLAGLGAFLLGHVAYIVAFAQRGFEVEAAAIAFGPLGAVAGGFSAWLLPKVPRPMRPAVVAYVVIITVMVALAFGSHARAPHLLLPVGAVLFWLSDISVAIDRFVARTAGNRLWGLPCYYAAQLVLALAVAHP